MNNKGFIATSLIYSFFLIFITLFLTIIADYLQNKVLLNTIEKGIKEDINNTIGIGDFEVGEFIGLSTVKDQCEPFEYYVISKIDYNNNQIILYSLDKYEDSGNTNNILNDLDTGYMNATYYNKILYSFNNSEGKSYKISDISDTLCVKPREKDNAGNLIDTSISEYDVLKKYETTDGYVTTSCTGVGKYRLKKELQITDTSYFSNDRATKCVNSSEDGAGFTYLKKVS